MVFNSFEYFIFLPIVFGLYWLISSKLRWQNLLVVISSYVFYGWWNKTFLLLIAFTTLCSYLSGLGIEYVRKQTFHSRPKIQLDWWMAALNIVLNLSILAVYKYYNFFAESLTELCAHFNYYPGFVTLNLVLPVGISFYTFQALSYTIDVYRRKLEPTHDIVSFFAFISFFPQLVAGPIERATNLLPQFQRPRNFNYATAVDGSRQILWGLIKKVIIADRCACIVDYTWEHLSECSSVRLIVAAVLFTFQIYGDFSGYSDIAIGSAKLFGIRLMRNFNYPYFSRDIAEFWRRWHISLTTWFRDYIYIPLGGSRCAKWKAMRNTLIIFLVSGFWHGANWTFVAWGAYHALLFFPLFLAGKNRKNTDIVAKGRLLPNCSEFFKMLFTFILAVVGWIIFRAQNLHEVGSFMVRMCSNFRMEPLPFGTMLYISIMVILEWLQRDKEHPLQIANVGPLKFRAVRMLCYYALIVLLYLLAKDQTTFIYFQF